MGEGYSLLLDDKPVMTPARHKLFIYSLPLAETIADEWRAQGEHVQPDSMPLSQMAMTLVDRVLPNREQLTTEVLGYIDTDLTCYRTGELGIYRTAQEEKWDPFVAWFRYTHSIPFTVTYGLTPLRQSPELHAKIAADVRGMNNTEFMMLYLVTIGTGSIIMGLAFVSGEFAPEKLVEAAFVEEQTKDIIYHSDLYGSAPDQERRIAALRKDLETLQIFLMLSMAAI